MSGYTVDPSRLRSAAAALDQLTGRLTSEQAAVRGAGANAGLGAGNVLASGAISGFTASWQRVLGDLARALGQDASMLRQNAHRYEQADAASAQHRGTGR
jgi:Excreted virulence factor EspC, type VII ESX diderm